MHAAAARRRAWTIRARLRLQAKLHLHACFAVDRTSDCDWHDLRGTVSEVSIACGHIEEGALLPFQQRSRLHMHNGKIGTSSGMP